MVIPRNLPVDLLHRAIHASQLITDLHDREPDHTRIKGQVTPNILLSLDTGVKLHHEVVALVVLRLVPRGGPGEVELAPVLHASDNAARVENLLADDAGDSG